MGYNSAMEKKFPVLLHRLRAEKKLTQQQLADKLFVDRSSVAHWEIGRRIPDTIIITRLAVCLNTDVGELMAAAAHDAYQYDDLPDNPAVSAPQILAADPDKAALHATLTVLKNSLPGAKIRGFQTTEEVRDFAADSSVSIAFLEVRFGRASGFELCRELTDINPRINVVFLTHSKDYSLKAWETSACGYLLKPLDTQALDKQIKKLRFPVRGLK